MTVETTGMKNPAKKKKLTPKQRKLVDGIISGKSQKEAAKAADMNEQYASEILKKPEVQQTLQQLMDQYGLSDAALLTKHKQLLDDENSSIRAKSLEMAYKLKGAFTEKVEHTGKNGTPIETITRIELVALD